MTDADKPALRPANDNPWYCLATLYGEVPDNGPDDEITNKNRLFWNRWIAASLSDEERTKLAENGFPKSELEPLSPEEKESFFRDFAARVGREDALPPDPAEPCHFCYTQFDRDVDFSRFLFKWVSFESATFAGVAHFGSVMFSDASNFAWAKFSRDAIFELAAFVRSANFEHVTFSFITANFSSATFFSIANFESATFCFNAEFFSTIFSNYAFFNDTKFFGRNIFLNATFSGAAIFVDAVFRYTVPDFRGATMHEATEWSTHDATWPKPPNGRDFAKQQIQGYERLKLEMERLKKHEDEQFFFRKELRARRGLTRPLSADWYLNFAYQASSNYGLSVWRPLVWLFVLFAVGCAAFYFVHATNPGATALTILHAAALSFGNIFPFVPSSHDFLSETPFSGWSRIEKVIALGQTLLGTPLLFLLGLALRNRFRMR
jgi:uncharacterized protein YjbI with pentapeptide repeats